MENLEQKNTNSEETENEKKEVEETTDENSAKVPEEQVEEETVDKEESPQETAATDETEEVEEETAEAEVADEAEEGAVAEETDEKEPVTEAAEEDQEEEEETGDSEAADESESENPEEFYSGIVERAKELVVQTDWAFVTTELANLAQNVSEGPESTTDKAKELVNEFQELKDNFEEKKQAYYEEQNRKKQENLGKKKELLQSLSDIVNEENWTATKKVGQIKGQWESIKLLPKGESESLDEKFNKLMDEFEDHKVDRLVKQREKEEENLELKLLLLDKMDALTKQLDENTPDFNELEDQFNKLISQWRKVGRVPSEKNQPLWDRFNKIQDSFNEIRFKVDKEYREQIEQALSKKKKLVKEAEALVDQENIAKAARKVNKLHRAWKKAGNLPQKDENDMWDMFKEATDKFNQKKSDNIDVLREQEEKNLDKKHDLIKQAEEIKGTDDFDAGHQKMQDLMSQWKKIGPVPRKKSSKIWKMFKSEMDEFYDRRREAFKGQRKDQKENLEEKEEILDKLEKLGEHEDPALAVQEAKKLQEEFKDIGYVPIKMKNKIWKRYREACDVIYDRYRALGSNLGLEKKLANQGIDPDTRKEIISSQKERDQLKKEVSKLESDMIQHEEAKTYFKPTKKGNVLLDELQQKIDKAEEAISEKEDKIYELNKKIDQLKRTGDKDEEE